MKAQKNNKVIKSMLLAVFAAMVTILVTSCTKKFTFLKSSVVPAANGFVKVKKDNNKNYIIKVEVSDLAEIERVQASKTTYVVWMETDEGNTRNMGQLISSSSFFSKRHTASLETVSSFKPVKIFITTEEGSNIQFPGSQIVLTTENFKVK